MARRASPPTFELELVPLLVTGGRAATSLQVVLECVSGLAVTLEPLTMPRQGTTFVGLEVAGLPAAQAEPVFELYDEVPVIPGAEGSGWRARSDRRLAACGWWRASTASMR